MTTDGPFYKGARGSMSRQRKARIFQRRNGICGNSELKEDDWGCGRKLRTATDRRGWSVEHQKALQNGGEDTDDNCYVICEWCLGKKNRADANEAAYHRKVYTNHVLPIEPKRSWGRR